MVRSRSLSPQARRLLAALAVTGGWRHGYDLCREAGILSGTLYLDAEWRPPETPGRPSRHVYRLTVAGRRLAAENPAPQGAAEPSGRLA